MAKAKSKTGLVRFSSSLVIQGSHRFYTLTMPSDILAECSYVSNRFDDPEEGFQRRLDKKRASEIAEYIDSGFGTIPSAVVLSAQPAAELEDLGRGKTVQFKAGPKSFLVLDGQHRVYGFSLASTALRVPVVIYNGLSRAEEARLFIDINTKQRPVPNELLLDIKALAKDEGDDERLLREVFDEFYANPNSVLLGRLSKASRSSNRISRVTFNLAAKPLIPVFSGREADDVYAALNGYLAAVTHGLTLMGLQESLTNPTVFRAFMFVFTEAAQRVSDRFGKAYTAANFYEVMRPAFDSLKPSSITKPGNAFKTLGAEISKKLKKDFVL
jgi:DGQHR domain-containing protein